MSRNNNKFPGLSLFTIEMKLKFSMIYDEWEENTVSSEKKVIKLTFAHPYKKSDGVYVIDVNRGFFDDNSNVMTRIREFIKTFEGAIIIQENTKLPEQARCVPVIRMKNIPSLENVSKAIYKRLDEIIEKNNLNLHLVSVQTQIPVEDQFEIITSMSSTFISPDWKVRYIAALKKAGINDPNILDKLN